MGISTPPRHDLFCDCKRCDDFWKNFDDLDDDSPYPCNEIDEEQGRELE